MRIILICLFLVCVCCFCGYVFGFKNTNIFFLKNKKITEKITENTVIDTPFFKRIACENIKNYYTKEVLALFANYKKTATNNPKTPLKIVCYGNSITNGFQIGTGQPVKNHYPIVLQQLLEKDGFEIDVTKQGYNGWRTDHALKNIQINVLDKKPQIVYLEFGINDAYSGFSLQLFEKNMLLLTKTLQNYQIIPIILTPTPITSKYKIQVEMYCEVLQKISTQHNISLINLQKYITQKAIQTQTHTQKLLPDNVHFADEFYAWIAEGIYEGIKK